MAVIYLLLGGNQGDRKKNLSEAKQQLVDKVGKIILKSSIYESEPWGFSNSDWFLNQVVVCQTGFTPVELLDAIQEIENNLGRVRKTMQYTGRTMDIDILFYDQLVLETERLSIPHKQIHNRKFTLEPLNEIAPDFIHASLQKPVYKLLSECKDRQKVHKI